MSGTTYFIHIQILLYFASDGTTSQKYHFISKYLDDEPGICTRVLINMPTNIITGISVIFFSRNWIKKFENGTYIQTLICHSKFTLSVSKAEKINTPLPLLTVTVIVCVASYHLQALNISLIFQKTIVIDLDTSQDETSCLQCKRI